MTREVQQIVSVVQRVRLDRPQVAERELQDRLADELVAAGYRVKREVRLDGAGRVDLYVNEGIVIEVKRGKPPAQEVLRQIQRYAASARVRGVVLVAERTLAGLQDQTEVAGKPVAYVALSTCWGVA